MGPVSLYNFQHLDSRTLPRAGGCHGGRENQQDPHFPRYQWIGVYGSPKFQSERFCVFGGLSRDCCHWFLASYIPKNQTRSSQWYHGYCVYDAFELHLVDSQLVWLYFYLLHGFGIGRTGLEIAFDSYPKFIYGPRRDVFVECHYERSRLIRQQLRCQRTIDFDRCSHHGRTQGRLVFGVGYSLAIFGLHIDLGWDCVCHPRTRRSSRFHVLRGLSRFWTVQIVQLSGTTVDKTNNWWGWRRKWCK